MKTNSASLTALLIASALLPAGASSVDELRPVEAFTETEVPLELARYAEAELELGWLGAGEEVRDALADRAAALHPSLAADLVDGGRRKAEATENVEREVTGFELAAFLDGPGQLPASAAMREARELSGLDRAVPAAASGVGPVYDIRGIPHPILAGMAALVGLALTVGRRDSFV